MSTFVVELAPIICINSEEFAKIVERNPEVRLELSSTGDLIIMPPTGSETGCNNSEINFQLMLWNQQYRLGKVFDSSTAFVLPNSAIRSPDASWIELSRWDALTREEKKRFSPICPDFVIELLSPSDRRKDIQAKLVEYINNGCLLGWLIDLEKLEVEIYRPEQEKELLNKPLTLSGENILPNFTLQLDKLYNE